MRWEVCSEVARSPRDLLSHSHEPAVVLIDANLMSHASWVDVKDPIAGPAHLVFFGVGSGPRDLCVCRSWNAKGLVGEGATLDELAEAANEVASGHFFIAPSASRLIRIAARRGEAKRLLLTRREQEVANLLSFGVSNSSIANELGISVETARIHVKHLLRKLDSATREGIAEKYVSYVAAEYESRGGVADGGSV